MVIVAGYQDNKSVPPGPLQPRCLRGRRVISGARLSPAAASVLIMRPQEREKNLPPRPRRESRLNFSLVAQAKGVSSARPAHIHSSSQPTCSATSRSLLLLSKLLENERTNGLDSRGWSQGRRDCLGGPGTVNRLPHCRLINCLGWGGGGVCAQIDETCFLSMCRGG